MTMAKSIDDIFKSIKDDANSLTEEQFVAFLKLFHIMLRQLQLSFEMGLETGQEALANMVDGLGQVVEDWELEVASSR